MNDELNTTVDELEETTEVVAEGAEVVGGEANDPERLDGEEFAEDVEDTEVDMSEESEPTEAEPVLDDSAEASNKEGAERYSEVKEVTEAELDEIADTTIETIREILKYFNAGEAEIDEYEGEEGELILDIVGDNLALLIGRHGKTLDSLQFIVSAIVSKKIGYRYPVVIDVEGYKQRRKQKLISLAKSSAARALRQKYEVRLRPMNPYERRIVHMTLRADNRIVTHSEGADPNRYIVIKPK